MPTLFPFVPEELVEQVQFRTDIRKTPTGEWRDSLADGFYGLDATFKLTHTVAAQLEGLVRSDPDAQFYVPLWQDMTVIENTTITSGTTTISVDTDADYRVGGKACLFRDAYEGEVLDVLSATGGTLTLSAGTSATYTAGREPLIVAPIVTGYLPNGIDVETEIIAAQVKASFYCADPADLSTTTPFPSIAGYEIMTDEAIELGGISGALAQDLEQIQNAFGHMDPMPVEEYARHRWMVSLFTQTQASRWRHRRWFHNARGRDMPFYLPTSKNDLPPAATIASGATTADVGRISPVDADHVGRYIQFRLQDGTTIHRAITSAGAGASADLVNIGFTAPGQTVDAATSVVSLMHLCRFDSDRIEISHRSGGAGIISEAQIPVIEVAG